VFGSSRRESPDKNGGWAGLGMVVFPALAIAFVMSGR
jgi:hypothetical protein